MTNIISAFSIDQVKNLTGLSEAQLRDWDGSEFFVPRFAAKNRKSPYSRIYSFDDIVELRVLARLRKDYHIPLHKLRKTAEKLRKYAGRPWSELKLYVLNREVHFKNPESGLVQGALTGQFAIPIELGSVADEMQQKVARIKIRDSSLAGETSKHRYVANNREVIAGTRITVDTIAEYIKLGCSDDQILAEYPSLRSEDIASVRQIVDGSVKAA